jgi:2-oxoglutarate dehydrogenase E1 component
MARAAENTSFLSTNNATFIAELYAHFKRNPNSVDPSWQQFFSELNDDERAMLGEMHGPSWAKRNSSVIGSGENSASSNEASGQKNTAAASPDKNNVIPLNAPPSSAAARQATLDSLRALMLIRAYRVRGHMAAKLDPLGLEPPKTHPELDPAIYGFGANDWDRPIFIDHVLGMETATLREIMALLKATYCGHIGLEYMHIQDPAQKAWLQERIESIHNQTQFTLEGKLAILDRLTAAEGIENFLHVKFPGTKRFGLDGGEALIPALEQVLKRGGQLGIKEVVVGMAHRGRLNVLTNVMSKRFAALFSEFQGTPANPSDVQGSGDVKYHLGASADRDFDGHSIHLSLTANPSHLECVNPVVVGKVRAKQEQRRDAERTEVLGLLIHGDAAFAGQGLVAETLAMSDLQGYRTGGTIHFVINNQIGFTTRPAHSRSGHYSTDVALMIQAPIFHVNGDDPEAVVHVARIATEYRQQFGKDVVVDMYCYRRFGHNEGDEPAFTQPLMYRAIKDHTPTRALYAAQLVKEGVISAEAAQKVQDNFIKHLEVEFEAATSYKPNKADWLEGKWVGFEASYNKDEAAWQGNTAVALDTLKAVGKSLTTVPGTFNINPKIARQLEAKAAMFTSGEGFDWATGEALAFGTLQLEGHYVRLSGQDCGRGTFSQRHSVLYDQENESKYLPLNNLPNASLEGGPAPYEVIDSNLSEAGVLGYEYGYSLAEPNALVMWEGQFGDFANGAQVIIDQFIASGETKWLRLSGLVMLLPHGYEGQGPEHSSARLERYLQMCAEENWQVGNLTTPANYFHALRRQLKRKLRKPLVLMTPKSLLRHKLCVSKLSDFGPGSAFKTIYADDLVDKKNITKAVLCSGKVYYDLWQARADKKQTDVAIIRVEQIYPFPHKALVDELKQYPKLAEVTWCQEEPENMGAWTFVDRRLEAVMKEAGTKPSRPTYTGRILAASPATGSQKRHTAEQAALVEAALKT